MSIWEKYIKFYYYLILKLKMCIILRSMGVILTVSRETIIKN